MTISNGSRGFALAGAALLATVAATQVSAAPPFFGGSYAEARTGSSVIGAGGGQVRVGAHLPPSLACSQVVSVRTGAGYFDNPGLDALNAAPVDVTIAPGECGNDWNREWVRFHVPHPKTSDILGLSFRDTAGRELYAERLAINVNESPSTPDD